jgi:beta-glucosidase
MTAAGRAFPDGFVWGTATAAHQVEGGNWNNDWWAWEHTPGSGCAEPSGDACDHWHRWPQDLQMLAGLGFGSYRFSLEWSRIEPEEDEYSTVALDHYLAMCAGCRELGIEPVVTFHHFTTPRWVAAAGGWAEPATAGYLEGRFPPGERDPDQRRRVNEVFVDAHAKATAAIKEAAAVPVGLTLAMSDNQAEPGGEATLAAHRSGWEDPYLAAAQGDDFIGVQTYTRHRFGPDGMLDPEPGVPLTAMGYELWPEALGATIRRAAAVTGVPVLVTENGIATDGDAQRIDFVRGALDSVLDCLADGVDVRGYTYWSLLDNFEWAHGYRTRFGLVAVDRTTQVRAPKPSAAWLGQVARANRLV